MSLKSAVIDMKEAIMNKRIGQQVEDYIKNLEMNNGLTPGTLVYYYNHFQLQMNQSNQNPSNQSSKKVNRKWTKFEIEFMFQYIKERQEEGALNITEILEEIALALDRGYQSVNYKYYNLAKQVEKKETVDQPSYKFTTIMEDEAPVLSTEIIYNKVPEKSVEAAGKNIPAVPTAVGANPSPDDDLLDILSGLISNVQKLPGIQLNELLRSLFHLTNLALQNQEAGEQLEAMKAEIYQEKTALHDQLKKREQQLIQEKLRNDELQKEVAKLANEITAFNQLGDAAKIQNLKSYNQRLNYIIDNFGVVLKIGS